MKTLGARQTYHGCAGKAHDPYLNEFVFRYNLALSTGTSRSKHCSGSPRTITDEFWDIVGATIPAKACRQSGADAARRQRPEWGRDQDPKN